MYEIWVDRCAREGRVLATSDGLVRAESSTAQPTWSLCSCDRMRVGTGLGRALVSDPLLDLAADRATIATQAWNVAALRLYESLGFHTRRIDAVSHGFSHLNGGISFRDALRFERISAEYDLQTRAKQRPGAYGSDPCDSTRRRERSLGVLMIVLTLAAAVGHVEPRYSDPFRGLFIAFAALAICSALALSIRPSPATVEKP
jgi:hypothetical protein